MEVLSGNAEAAEGDADAGIGQRLCNGAAETTGDEVILRRDDVAGFLCGLDDGVLVERLDRVHIDHADGNAFLGKSVCRRDGQRDERAGGDDGEVGAVEGGDGLADFVVIVLRGIDGRLCAAGDAEADGAGIFQRGADGFDTLRESLGAMTVMFGRSRMMARSMML